MKKNQSSTDKLTQAEKRLLNNCLRMHEWHFEKLFGDSCSLISRSIIGWEKEDLDSKYATKPVGVLIYGLNAINSETKKLTIANFFIHYEYKVYQEWYIDGALKIRELIKKEYLIEKNKEKANTSKRNKERKVIPIKKVA